MGNTFEFMFRLRIIMKSDAGATHFHQKPNHQKRTTSRAHELQPNTA